MTVVYTKTALADIQGIYEYIAFELLVPQAAEALTERILAAIRTLGSLPERNPLYQEEPWFSQGVRYMPIRNYPVFYTVKAESGTVSVARVLYGGRDISRQLEETGEW